jgi:hypothetical protein
VSRRRATRSGRHAISVAVDHVVDLIFGRWRSQILYAGAALDVFAHLKPDQDRAAAGVASKIGTDPAMLYRLFRALAAIGLLAENEARNFASPRRVHCFELITRSLCAQWRCWKKARSIYAI